MSEKNSKSPSEILRPLFESLSAIKLPYCVLRNYEGLPERVGNDVDCFVPETRLADFAAILLGIGKGKGWQLVRHESRYGFHSYYLASPEQARVLHLDVLGPHHWKGLTWISEKHVLDSRMSRGSFYVPGPGVEAGLLLMKELLPNASIKQRYKARVQKLIEQDPDRFYTAFCQPFGDERARMLLEKTQQGDWKGLLKMQPELKRTLLLRAIARNPWGQLVRWEKFLLGHLVEVFFRPTGFFLVLMGPDGAGKTSVASGVEDLLRPTLFYRAQTSHFRPGLLPGLRSLRLAIRRRTKAERSGDEGEGRPRTESPSPHAETGDTLMWLIRLFYYTFDFVLGHFQVWLNRARGYLVIYDRYYYEYIIQQAEGPLPVWLPRLFMRIVPQPDAVVYLSNSAAAIFERKQELSLQKIESQSEMYEKLVTELPHAHRIRTDCSLSEVVDRVRRIVMETMAERYRITD